MIDGRLVHGAGGFAGESGHGPVIREPPFACGCGQAGCLDTVGSARGLERLHRHLTGQDLTSVEILARWDQGPAMAAVDLWLDLVSGVLSMVVNLTGASIVPVGGGLANAPALIAALNVTEVHASCAAAVPGHPDPFGFVTGTEQRTDRARVPACRR